MVTTVTFEHRVVVSRKVGNGGSCKVARELLFSNMEVQKFVK